MKKSGTVLATLGQIKEICALLIQAIPSNLTKEAAQQIIANKGNLIKAISRAFAEIIGSSGYEGLLDYWVRFYKEVFGEEVDFSKLELPAQQEGFGWLIVGLKGLTPNRLFSKCQERFASRHCTDDLDTIKSARTADKTYAIRVRDRIEADEENKNKSANDCSKEGIKVITLEERLLLELFYHWRTGKHLDVENITLCSGSRCSDGGVPGVDWGGGKLSVDWYGTDDCNDNLRARAVSL